LSCPQCGLLADRFASYADSADDDIPPTLTEAWAGCEADWENPVAHDRFLEAASASDMYAFAARHYRRAIGRGLRDDVARSYLERVTRMVEARALVAAAGTDNEPREPYKGVLFMLVLLVLAAGVGGVWMMTRMSDEPASRPPSGELAPESTR
jgi:hypothetical protein